MENQFTAASPETQLPCIDLSTKLINENGSQKPITLNQVGTFLLSKYTMAPTNFIKEFIAYQDQHAMGSIRNQLKAGLDKISCDYIDVHERIINLGRLGNLAFADKNCFWTDFDRTLFEHNRKIMKNPPTEWMATINLEGNSMITNGYGLTFFDQKVIDQANGKDIIDAGAFIGDTIPVFRSLFPNSTTYCFEPSELNHQKMLAIAEGEIEAGHVKAIKQGLSSHKGTMELSTHPSQVCSMASVINKYQNAHTEQISVTTIDYFAKEQDLDVGVIKIDIEGFEMDVIKGALDTIKTKKPLLLVAIYHNPEEFYELKGFLEQLNLGYKFAIRRSSFVQGHTELVLIAYQ